MTCPRSQSKSGPAGLRVWQPRLHTGRSLIQLPLQKEAAPRCIARRPGRQGAAPGFPPPPGATRGRRSPRPRGAPPAPTHLFPARGTPNARLHPAAASGRCLGPPPPCVPGPRTAPPRRSARVGLVLRDHLPRARASRPKAPRRGPRGVTETPRRGALSPPQRPRDGRRGRTGCREGPGAPLPGRHSAPSAYPLPAAQVRTPGSPARVLLPRFAPRLSAGGRRISAATPAELPAPPAPPPPGARSGPRPRGPSSFRPGRRPAARAPRSANRARRSSSLPSPSSSPARLAPHSAPRPRPAGSAPCSPGPAGSSEPPPPPPAQPQGWVGAGPAPDAPPRTCRRAGGLGPQWRVGGGPRPETPSRACLAPSSLVGFFFFFFFFI